MLPVRFAVVGVTGYSVEHLRQVEMLESEGRARLVASMVIDLPKHPQWIQRCQERGVRLFTDYHEMLEKCSGEVDIVTLPTPIHLHAPMTVEALRAGNHVLVEKPLAGCVSDVDEMISASKETGKVCVVGFQALSCLSIRKIREILSQGRLGRIMRIRQYAIWPRPHKYYARNNWAGKLTVDGRPVLDSPFSNALGHQIMNMLFLDGLREDMSSPDGPCQSSTPVDVRARLFRAYPIESFDSGAIWIKTDRGTEILFTTTHACRAQEGPKMILEAERGTVEWEFSGHTTIHYDDGQVETFEGPISRVLMFQNLLDATLSNASPNCSLETARNHTLAIEWMHRDTEIQSVDPSLVTDRDGQISIEGVEEVTRASFESCSLTPWERLISGTSQQA